MPESQAPVEPQKKKRVRRKRKYLPKWEGHPRKR